MTQSSIAGGNISLVRGCLHVHVGGGNTHALADGLKLSHYIQVSNGYLRYDTNMTYVESRAVRQSSVKRVADSEVNSDLKQVVLQDDEAVLISARYSLKARSQPLTQCR